MNEKKLYKIEHNIPLPKTRSFSGLFASLAIGDSVVIPAGKRLQIASIARHKKIKLISRAISDTEVRVWRIANNGDQKP